VSGSTDYTFTENGTFTFHFEDAAGNRGSKTALVDRIDKTAPQAVIVTYAPSRLTHQEVIATLYADEPVTVLSSGRVPRGTITGGIH
jgi:hypothetical protein